MGSYDGAETCELVELYLLNKLTKIIPANQLGLYRDDGLSIIPRANGPKMDKLRKDITKIFFKNIRTHWQKAATKKFEKYEPKDANLNRKRRRKRKIIWFNPPFNKNLKTESGRKFFNLFDRHFPKTHKYHKVFNRNNVKLSYSCTENMGMLIKKINKKKLEKVSENRPQLPNTPQLTNCNCRNKQNCPLNGKCLESSLDYKAELKTEDDTFNYMGLTEGTIKDRITKHKTSFKHPQSSLQKQHWTQQKSFGIKRKTRKFYN